MTLLTIYATAIILPISAVKPTCQNTNSVPYDTPESRFYLRSFRQKDNTPFPGNMALPDAPSY